MKTIKCKTRAEWLEQRKLGIGGSDIVAIMGLSNYTTPLDIYNSKIGKESENTEQQKSLFLRGNILEKSSIEWYNETHEEKATHLNNVIWVSDESKTLRFSPDGIINGDGLIECKSHRDYEDEVKDSTYAQLQWGLGVSGLKWGVVVWINSNLQWYEKEYPFNEEYFELQKKHALDFINNQLNLQIPPDPISAYDSMMLYPEALLGKTTKPPENYSEMKYEYGSCVRKIKILNDKKEAIVEIFKMEFEDAETMIDDEGNIVATYKNSIRKAYEVKESATRRLNLKIPRSI